MQVPVAVQSATQAPPDWLAALVQTRPGEQTPLPPHEASQRPTAQVAPDPLGPHEVPSPAQGLSCPTAAGKQPLLPFQSALQESPEGHAWPVVQSTRQLPVPLAALQSDPEGQTFVALQETTHSPTSQLAASPFGPQAAAWVAQAVPTPLPAAAQYFLPSP